MTLEYFRDNICSTCKNKCDKAIVIEKLEDTEIIKCINYEKDKNKVQGYFAPLFITGKQHKPIMYRFRESE